MRRTSRHRFGALVTALFIGAGLALAACGGGNDEAAPTTTSAPSTTTTAGIAAGTGPLTGLPVDAAHAARPALVVKIDNAPKARPQAGINEADVVVEEGVEGGVTRFAVIFHSQDAASVGPVRSARSTDIAIARALGRPLFSYSGANTVFAELLRTSPLVDVGVSSSAKAAYRREKGRPGPYDLFSLTPPLFAAAPADAAPPPPLFTYRAPGEAPPSGYEAARKVQALWKDKVQTKVVYEWDEAAGGFARTTNDTPHVDAAGARVAPQNVVLQLVAYHNTGLVDRSGTAVPEAELVGEGEVLVLTGGRMVKGRWSKPAPEAVTAYTDAAGAPIRLTPGRTWVELVPVGMLTVSPG